MSTNLERSGSMDQLVKILTQLVEFFIIVPYHAFFSIFSLMISFIKSWVKELALSELSLPLIGLKLRE